MVSSIVDSIFTIFHEKWWGMMHEVSLHPLHGLTVWLVPGVVCVVMYLKKLHVVVCAVCVST